MTVFISLSPERLRYLEYLSARDEVSLSRALSGLIDEHAPGGVVEVRARQQLTRKHFTVNSTRLALIDALAIKWGVMRYAVVARLIDEASETDPRRVLPARCA